MSDLASSDLPRDRPSAFVRSGVPMLALAAYVAWWLLVLNRPVQLDFPVVVGSPIEGSTWIEVLGIVVPALALGALVGRWWAPVGGIAFVIAALRPKSCELSGDSGACWDVTVGDVIVMLIVTTPFVLAGVWARGRLERRRPAEPAPA